MNRAVTSVRLAVFILALTLLATPIAASAAPAVEAADGPLWAIWNRLTSWVNSLSGAAGTYADPYGTGSGTGSATNSSSPPPPPESPILIPESGASSSLRSPGNLPPEIVGPTEYHRGAKTSEWAP